MRRLATRIAMLEVRLRPPSPFVISPRLQASIDVLTADAQKMSGGHATLEWMLEHMGCGCCTAEEARKERF